MKLRFGIIAVALIFLGANAFFAPPSPAHSSAVCEEQLFRVSGQVQLSGSVTGLKSVTRPLKGVFVEILADGITAATTLTNQEGRFSVKFSTCLARATLKMALTPNDGQISVSRDMNPKAWRFVPATTIANASPGKWDFGRVTVESGKSLTSRALQVFGTASVLKDWFEAKLGKKNSWRPIDIDFPSLFSRIASVADTFYNPITRQIHLARDRFPPDEPDVEILAHEFAHFLQAGYGEFRLSTADLLAYAADGRSGWTFSSREKPGVADLEGFATFLAYVFLAENGSPSYGTKLESDALTPALGAGGVFNHAGFYYDLFDAGQDRDEVGHVDSCQIPLDKIMAVFAAHDEKGLKAFALMKEDARDYAERFARLYGDSLADCSVSDLIKLNHL